MTDTNTLAPADAEILDAAEDFRSQYTHGGTTFDEFDALDFARAVLAKWGTPAPVGVALSDDLRDRLVAISEAIADQDDRAAQAMLREILKAPQPSPTAQAAPTPVLHLVHSAFAEIAMAFPKAFALHKVGIADTAVREALAALKDCLEDTCGSGDSRALCKQPLPAPLADRQPAPAKLVEAVTKAILFEDTGSIEGWEENTNLGEAAIRVCDARNPPRCSYCHSATGAPLAAPPTDSVTAPAGGLVAEARAQDTALIRQLAEAIKMDRIDWEDWPDDSRTAFEKIRARLLDSDLSKLTARGAKAWTGIDAQDLRNGGKP